MGRRFWAGLVPIAAMTLAAPSCGHGGGKSGPDASDGGDAGAVDASVDAASDAGLDLADAGATCLPTGDGGAAPPDAGLVLVADGASGFSGTQGACSWSYGYLEPAGDNTFHLMTDWDAAGPLWWVLRGSYWTLVGPDVQHPNGAVTTGGRMPVEQWSVRRWTSTVTGNITISGSVRKSADAPTGDGVDARILVDGVQKYSQFIAGADTVGVSFAVAAPVAVGSVVDFMLGPHANDATDTTFFSAQIWN